MLLSQSQQLYFKQLFIFVFGIIINMNCEIHKEQVRFVCQSDNCYFQPLCQTCFTDHSKKHKTNESIPFAKAIQLASNNLTKQKQTLDELLQPFAKRKQLTQKIEDQKKQLKKQRDRLVKYIDDYIDQQINKLVKENSSMVLNSLEKQLQKDLQEKLDEINTLFYNYRKKPLDLQKSLNLQLERFMETLSKNHSNLYGTNHFRYYSSLTHEIMLSRLELTSENTTTKPFRKIMNESPLYFLIDSKFNLTNLLFNFNIKKQQIEIYNTIDQQWLTFHSKEFQINPQGCGIHDPKSNRFYWIGGVRSNNRKSDTVLVFSLNEGDKSKKWSQIRLRNARSSCMASLIQIEDEVGNPQRGILIVGGLGDNGGEILKSCEYIDLQTSQVFPFGQTNFATFSGTLVVYKNSTVLRLGGLSKNKGDYSVVEVVEKIDCQESYFNYKKDNKEPRWSYIELELPKGQSFAKPKLFYANQASIQINPNEIFVFGGLDAGLKGATQSYLIGVEQFLTPSREVKGRGGRQQKFSVRWVNEKPLISGDDFSGLRPTIWKQRLFTFQNMGNEQQISEQKRLLQFDMYQWYETECVLPS